MNSEKDNVTTIYSTTIFINTDSDAQEIREWNEGLKSILQQVPSKADSLKPIIQFLVTTIAPAKIYMLKTEDTNKQSVYIDLLLVISRNTGVPFTELEPMLDIAYLKDKRVNCSLHNEGNVVEGLKSGHIFYSLNCIPENLVYDDKKLTYPTTSPEALQVMKKNALEKFINYHGKATDFFDSAISLSESHSTPIALFMLHQAVELIYRGILFSLNGYDKKTHEIRALKKYVRRCAPQINECFLGISENEERLLDILDSAYLRARYQDNYAIDENDLATLFERVKQLLSASKEFVQTKVGRSSKA